MSIIGFNFTKILVEKTDTKSTGKVQVSNNVSLKNVEESNLKISSKDQMSLKYEFMFESKYDPKLGSIILEGNVISIGPRETNEKIVEEWKKSKKVNPSAMKSIMNTILAKANVQALILSRDVNLPSPIPLPKVEVKE